MTLRSTAQKGVRFTVRAIEARNPQLEMAQMLQQKKSVFSLPGCQQMSVNTLLCDAFGLAEGVFLFVAKDLQNIKT